MTIGASKGKGRVVPGGSSVNAVKTLNGEQWHRYGMQLEQRVLNRRR